VLASDVGGVPEALGSTSTGERPGLLTPAGDASALTGSLRRWLEDAVLRRRLRTAAQRRRTGMAGWADTAALVARALEGAAA
jgi:glycosyltransferase involved in cell wall biosynthesis